MKAIFTIALAILLLSQDLQAHGGGLDRYGCHAGSQPYHCHRSSGGGGGGGGGGGEISDGALILSVVLIAAALVYVIIQTPNKATKHVKIDANKIVLSSEIDRSAFTAPLLPNTPIQASWVKRHGLMQADSLRGFDRPRLSLSPIHLTQERKLRR